MNADEARAKVVEAVKRTAGGTVTDDSQLENDLGLDWLDRVELVMVIEYELGIVVTSEEMDSLKTVGDLVKLAQAQVELREAAEARGKTAP